MVLLEPNHRRLLKLQPYSRNLSLDKNRNKESAGTDPDIYFLTSSDGHYEKELQEAAK